MLKHYHTTFKRSNSNDQPQQKNQESISDEQIHDSNQNVRRIPLRRRYLIENQHFHQQNKSASPTGSTLVSNSPNETIKRWNSFHSTRRECHPNRFKQKERHSITPGASSGYVTPAKYLTHDERYYKLIRNQLSHKHQQAENIQTSSINLSETDLTSEIDNNDDILHIDDDDDDLSDDNNSDSSLLSGTATSLASVSTPIRSSATSSPLLRRGKSLASEIISNDLEKKNKLRSKSITVAVPTTSFIKSNSASVG